MEIRTYTKLSNMSSEEIIERKRKQKRESKERAKVRKQAEKLGLPIPPKLYINQGKSISEIKRRKNELNKKYTGFKYKKITEEDVKREFIDFYPKINLHYLNRYIKIIYSSHINLNSIEKHHILPKSIFPKYMYTKDNLVEVSPRVHFLVHWILVKMLPANPEMNYAFHLMTNINTFGNRYISSKRYEAVSMFTSITKRKRNSNKRRLQNGTHPFINHNSKVREEQLRKVKDGSHHFLNIKPWNGYKVTQESLRTWKCARAAYLFYCENLDKGKKTLYNYLQSNSTEKLSVQSTENMLKKLRLGWIPDQDPEWIEFMQK